MLKLPVIDHPTEWMCNITAAGTIWISGFRGKPGKNTFVVCSTPACAITKLLKY
jgi:hypothetical protein